VAFSNEIKNGNIVEISN